MSQFRDWLSRGKCLKRFMSVGKLFHVFCGHREAQSPPKANTLEIGFGMTFSLIGYHFYNTLAVPTSVLLREIKYIKLYSSTKKKYVLYFLKIFTDNLDAKNI